ncbi:MAG: hypothetical protein ACREJU_08210 [Nitrospiraceae bacterium]
MKVSTEEFFMGLIIALIVLAPISARIYRYLTAKRVKQMLHEQFGRQEEKPGDVEKRT